MRSASARESLPKKAAANLREAVAAVQIEEGPLKEALTKFFSAIQDEDDAAKEAAKRGRSESPANEPRNTKVRASEDDLMRDAKQ